MAKPKFGSEEYLEAFKKYGGEREYLQSPDAAQSTSHSCDQCGCDEGVMYLHSMCHPDAPTWAALQPDGTTLIIECSVCYKPIAKFTGMQEVN